MTDTDRFNFLAKMLVEMCDKLSTDELYREEWKMLRRCMPIVREVVEGINDGD